MAGCAASTLHGTSWRHDVVEWLGILLLCALFRQCLHYHFSAIFVLDVGFGTFRRHLRHIEGGIIIKKTINGEVSMSNLVFKIKVHVYCYKKEWYFITIKSDPHDSEDSQRPDTQ